MYGSEETEYRCADRCLYGADDDPYTFVCCGRSYSFGYAIFSNQTMAKEGAGRDVYVTVGADDTVKDVAKLLKKERLIKDTLVFEVQEKLSTYKDKIQLGTYILNTEQTAEEMLAILSGTDTEGQPGADSESSTTEGKSAS